MKVSHKMHYRHQTLVVKYCRAKIKSTVAYSFPLLNII